MNNLRGKIMIEYKFNLELFKTIMNIPSPSGYTVNMTNFLIDYCKENNFTYESNKKGNIIITIPGEESYTIGLSAHVDTLGLMVRSIRGDGHLSFTSIGGILLPTLDGEYCQIHTRDNKVYTGTVLSTSPSAHVYKDSRSSGREESNMYIRLDEEVRSKNDTLALGINNGDFITIDPKFVATPSGFIKSRFLDDKASVFILLSLLNYIKENNLKPKKTLKIIFSTYEEVGHGASNIPQVDELLAVDMGCIGDDLACTEYDVSICAKDSSGPYDYEMVNTLINLAKDNKISYAVDIYPYYGSDVSAALRSGNDIKGALIGAGIHASHGMERTHLKAIQATFNLLLLYINN